jgi:hypothetical protein
MHARVETTASSSDEVGTVDETKPSPAHLVPFFPHVDGDRRTGSSAVPAAPELELNTCRVSTATAPIRARVRPEKSRSDLEWIH